MKQVDREPEIVLDLSRLLSRVFQGTPTGVDRCEMAYARGLLLSVPERLSFAAVHPFGIHGRIDQEAALRFLDATEQRWNRRTFTSTIEIRKFAARMLIATRPKIATRRNDARPFYIKASPNNLTNPQLIASILRRERARLICLVHDLIPLEYPEYAREGGAAEHEIRIRTVLNHADGIICNSQATFNALRPWGDKIGRFPPSAVAHLGTHLEPHSSTRYSVSNPPYFVCVGTIEPRKNHLLLLNLWRRMSEIRDSSSIAKLVIIGRRGWENEQVVDMLERCPALKDCVEERGRLTDHEAISLLRHSRALLMPSFAEGYGMPISEALALGVPVLCSDLAALREAGGSVPDFLDPLDGPAWMNAIDDLSGPSSTISIAQARRRIEHVIPTWSQHIAILLDLLHRLEA